MGIIDRVGDALGDGYDAARGAAGELADTVGSAASGAVDAVQDTAAAALDRVAGSDAATETVERPLAGISGQFAAAALRSNLGVDQPAQAACIRADPALTERAAGFLRDVGSRALHEGNRLMHAADALADRVTDEVSDGIRAVGHEAAELGERATRLTRDVAEGVRSTGDRLAELGERGVELAGQGLRQVQERAGELTEQGLEAGRRTLDDVREAASGLADTGREMVDRVTDTFDPGAQLDALDSEGDSLKLSLGGFAQVEVRGEAQGELEAQRTADGGYQIEATGRVGAGLIGQLGVDAGETAEVSARGLLHAGGKVTMQFATREEAERALETMGRMAAVGAAGAAGSGVAGPLGSAAASAGAQALIGPSGDDLAFLADRTRSVELRGGAALAVAGELGVAETLNLGGEAQVTDDVGVVIHLPQRDATGAVTRGASVGVFREFGFQARGEAAAVGAVNADVEGKARFETSAQLPTSVTGEALLRDPRGTLRSLATETRPGPVTMRLEGNARAGGGVSALYGHAGVQGGTGFELTTELGPGAARAAAGRLARGDVQGALGGLGDDVVIQGNAYTFDQSNLRFTPEVSGFGLGVGMEAQYQVRDKGRLHAFRTSPSQVLAIVAQHAGRARAAQP
jgi:hypothetical protein